MITSANTINLDTTTTTTTGSTLQSPYIWVYPMPYTTQPISAAGNTITVTGWTPPLPRELENVEQLETWLAERYGKTVWAKPRGKSQGAGRKGVGGRRSLQMAMAWVLDFPEATGIILQAEEEVSLAEELFPLSQEQETIRKEGEFYVVYSKDGSRSFGRYRDRSAAERRLKQIEFFRNAQ